MAPLAGTDGDQRLVAAASGIDDTAPNRYIQTRLRPAPDPSPTRLRPVPDPSRPGPDRAVTAPRPPGHNRSATGAGYAVLIDPSDAH